MAAYYYPSKYFDLHQACPSATTMGDLAPFTIATHLKTRTFKPSQLGKLMFRDQAERFDEYVSQQTLPNNGIPITFELPLEPVGLQRRAIIFVAGEIAVVSAGRCKLQGNNGNVCVTVVGDKKPQTFTIDTRANHTFYTVDTSNTPSNFDAFRSDNNSFGMAINAGYTNGRIAVRAAYIHGPSITAIVPTI